MKRVLMLFVVFAYASAGAQPPDFEDLITLYADGKYDKLLDKCTKYETKPKTAAEPLPHLYKSMAFFEIHSDQTWVQKNPEFARAYGSALRYAASFKKKDNRAGGKIAKETFCVDYLNELKDAILGDVDLYMHGEKVSYRKAAAELKRWTTFAPEDPGAWLLLGTCKQRDKVRAEAKIAFTNANAILDSLNFTTDILHLHSQDQIDEMQSWDKEEWKRAISHNATARALMRGLIETAIMYREIRQPDKAKKYINIGFQWYENIPEYKEVYDDIVNS